MPVTSHYNQLPQRFETRLAPPDDSVEPLIFSVPSAASAGRSGSQADSPHDNLVRVLQRGSPEDISTALECAADANRRSLTFGLKVLRTISARKGDDTEVRQCLQAAFDSLTATASVPVGSLLKKALALGDERLALLAVQSRPGIVGEADFRHLQTRMPLVARIALVVTPELSRFMTWQGFKALMFGPQTSAPSDEYRSNDLALRAALADLFPQWAFAIHDGASRA
jgi:hypothetical protein